MSQKIALIIGTTLLYFSAIVPVGAVEVSSWTEINTNKAEPSIVFTGDIQAEESPQTIQLNSTSPQIIDGGHHSLVGASGYQIKKTAGTDLTIQNFGSVTNGTADDNSYLYVDTEGNTVYKKITGSISNFSKSPIQANSLLLQKLAIKDTVFSNNTGKLVDVWLKNATDTASISNVVFYKNKVTADDAAILNISKGNVSIDHLVFDSNDIGAWALGLDFSAGTSTTINDSIFQNNKTGCFGVLQLSGGLVTIDNSQFVDNYTKYADGGAITITATMDDITNSVFKGNRAEGNGGAIWYAQFVNSPRIYGSTFEGNESGDMGGALFMTGTGVSTGALWLENSTFSGNTAASLGGGLVAADLEKLTLMNNTFTGNDASYGGGIFAETQPTFIVDTNFSDNTATEGGALYVANADTAIIADKSDVVFSGNTATNDADDYNGGSDIYFQADSYNATLSLNAASGKKVIFDGSIASYYENDEVPTIEVNKSGITYNTYDGTTETSVTAGTDGEVQFNGKIGDETCGFNINQHAGTLSFGQNARVYADLNVQGGTLNIANNEATVTNVNFGSNSTLSLAVNSASDYGSLTAESITVANGAKLQATLAQGIVAEGETVSLQLLSANNTDFNNFTDSFSNNMYHFEKADKNGLYNITYSGKTAEDVVIENGGQAWVADMAKAYLDSAAFDAGSVAADIADKLNVLVQNDAKALISELKALSPTEAAVVQKQTMTDIGKLFKSVDNHLQGKREPMGMSAGDTFSDVTLWAKPYIGKAKVSKRGQIAKRKSTNIGIIAAIEKEMNPDFKLGAGLHYDEMDVDILKRDIEAETLAGFAYAEYRPRNWFVNVMASYAHADYDEHKSALGANYDASYDVKIASMATTAGYQLGDFTPAIGFDYHHIKRDGYTDTTSQYVHKLSSNYLRMNGGVYFVKNYGIFCPDIYLGLGYDILNPDNNTWVSLTNGTSYFVDGEKLPRLRYELNVGLNTYLTDNLTLGINYFGAYRRNYQEHSGMIKLRYHF